MFILICVSYADCAEHQYHERCVDTIMQAYQGAVPGA